MNNTLVKHDGYVTAVINQPCLEPGVLHYIVEYQINDSTYPDAHKRIFQEFTSDIELCKGNGDTLDIDVQAMFGDTIDDKFNSYDASILALGTATTALNASILGITQKNSVQDASINRIEDIISTIDGGTSGSIDRLDTSVNALSRDVSTLNRSVDTLSSEQEIMSQNLSNVTNTVNDVSTRVDGFESALANKADVSVLSNYYTTGETYTKSEVDRAIADAALDGQLPAGVVVDANYVHTDNNYSNEDKAKVRDFDLTGYPTNSSLVANYATKAELQNVDNNHPTNASVNATYLKKSELAGELSDYPTNSSVSTNYAKKNDVSQFVSIADVSFWVSEEGFITGNDVSQFATETWVNENYCDLENIDEIICNVVDNNYDFKHKIIELIDASTAVKDIPDLSTNVMNVSTKIDNVSTKLTTDYLTASAINQDFVKNASLSAYALNSSIADNYTTKTEFNEVWTTFVTAEQVDETYAKKDDISTFITEDDISTFITSDDVSNFVTTNDISTFITEDDASIYLTEADMSNYVTDSSLSENYLRYYQATYKPGNTSFNLKNIKNFDILNSSTVFSIGNWGIHTGLTLGQKFKGKGTIWSENKGGSVITNMYQGNVYSGILLGTKTWTGKEFTGSDTRLYTKVDSYNNNDLTVTFDLSTYLMTNDDVSTYVSAKFASKDDISTFITSNDVSIYATTSYVDTQIGNIQNILQTI